ncbi:MAG TPA: ATP-binding protein [Caulobacteraceae bacterium]|nr:ATP-binding protein [Caulobacteraceae bacterium]
MDKADPYARVLIFAPVGRDGPAAADFIRRGKMEVFLCASYAEFLSELRRGAAVVLLAEEGLFGRDTSALTRWIAEQPAWSDLPFVVLTSHQEHPAVDAWRTKLVTELRNVSLLERPIQTITLTSTVRAALRARMRQYEVRALLEDQARAAQELEAQVTARTAELAETNVQLRAQMVEKSRVEEVLRQTQKIEAIGQLSGGVAHDFNNLLMVISGGLEMLDRQPDPVRRRRLLEGMQQAAQRGAALTRQLLAFSRRSPLKPESVDLKTQIGGMREILDRSLRGDVHVEFSFPEDLWPVAVDPGELELVILNLAVNARDAMPKGGTIQIRATNVGAEPPNAPAGDFVRLTITDEGVGMSDEVKAHVFEPFYTTKGVGHGSGLGLAQVHGFATQSGGSVQIESEIGQGTTVTLLLPRSKETPTPVEHHFTERTHLQASPAAGSVLVVEDDDEVASLVAEMLVQLGYEVIRAASAAGALGALANGRTVDLIFSDIMMPGDMNGVDLAREVRRRCRNLPVLLTSGYADGVKDIAAAEGMRVLPKPYRLDELAAAISTELAAGQRPERSTTCR